MKDKILKAIKNDIQVKEDLLKNCTSKIEQAAEAVVSSISSGGKLLIFGNGGSAADSQHIAAELVGRFKKERKAIAAVALTTNTSTLTAIGNDYGYDATFSRQVEAIGKRGDVALAISTSGKSQNVMAAVRKAREMGIKTIALTGGTGGPLAKECDIAIVVGSGDTPRIQESHILIGHIICELIEDAFSK